ncbi:hypothetical protein [Hyalangium gracile]|uniref:hypothetical protein n=1 Tax=Hyalangium gracile TaxID=394092 RepID=UPI001CCBFA87|nr:hypothetical protein [Hyalangium gracile]
MLLLVPACAGLLAWLLLRTAPLIDRLVNEARAMEGAVRPRPPHVSPPSPGTFAVELAALETRIQVSEGHVLEAVDTCMDALALSRDLSLGGGLHGSQLSASSQQLVYRPCAEALDAAPVERKRQALTQLARLREGIAPPSAVLREESVFRQLTIFGPDFFPPEAISRLSPAARKLVDVHGGWSFFTHRIGHPLLRRYVWRRNSILFDRMVAVADLPPADRQRAFTRIDADHALLAGYPGTESAVQYHQELAHLEPQRLQALALIALVQVDIARTEQGHWPATLPAEPASPLSLNPIGEREARLTPTDAASAEHALTITADTGR